MKMTGSMPGIQPDASSLSSGLLSLGTPCKEKARGHGTAGSRLVDCPDESTE
jgi:hypothetical protein